MKTKIGTLVMILAVLVCGVASRTAIGQTSPFLCSAGPRDGVACTSDDDCFVACPSSYGACVLIQGLCNGGDYDGFPCDCPGGACVGSGATGTCQGGAFAGDPCKLAVGEGSCDSGIACVGSQKVCASGAFRGFGCLNAGQCDGAACISTGKYCETGDYADYSCVTNADCTVGSTGGVCTAPDFGCAPAQTPTRTTTPVRTFTSVPTSKATSTPIGTVTAAPTGSTPTRTPIPTGTPVPPTSGTSRPTASVTPTIANSAIISEFAPAGSYLLVVQDASKLALSGTITYVGDKLSCAGYTRSAGGNILAINPAVSEDVPAGTVLQFGPCLRKEEIKQDASCAISSTPNRSGLWLIVVAAAGLFVRRSRRTTR